MSCTTILKIAVALLLCTSTAFATKYEFKHTQAPQADCASNGRSDADGGTITNITSTYDSVTNEFSWTTTFAPCQGVLPNGFWNVVNNGQNPKGHSGELAIFYFDATDPQDIVVSVYAYNGKNPLSYRNGRHGQAAAPDRIATSKNGNAPWLLEAFVIDNQISGERTMHLKMDGNFIKAHTPLYPDNVDPWFGIGYENFIGYWFHAHADLTTAYCEQGDVDGGCNLVAPGQSSVGFLKAWSHGATSYADKSNQKTNTVPYCIGKYKKTGRNGVPLSDSLLALDSLNVDQNGCHQLAIGENFYAEITGKDADQEELLVSYSGAPVNAVITPANGSINPSPVTATFDWTPNMTNQDSEHTVVFSFMDEHEALAHCQMKFCVPQDLDPVCDIKITSNSLTCGGVETYVDFDASGSSDPEQGGLTYQWFTTCQNSQGQLEQLDVSNDTSARLTLTQPGEGNAANCSVGVIVTDMFNQTTSCDVPVNIDGCELDCLDQPNGDAELDECGVCNGNNSCMDCLDIPNGDSKYDLCGVCNGNNDCLDCKGTPNGDAKYDQCNVCEGDGTSCLDCRDLDITQLLFQLDGMGIEQYQTLRYTTKLLRRKGTSRKRNRRYINNVLQIGTELKNANWVLTWSMPQIFTQCANTDLCVEVSNEATINTYNANAEELHRMTRRVLRRMRRQIEERKKRGRKSRFASKYNRRARQQKEEALELSSSVPTFSSACF